MSKLIIFQNVRMVEQELLRIHKKYKKGTASHLWEKIKFVRPGGDAVIICPSHNNTGKDTCEMALTRFL